MNNTNYQNLSRRELLMSFAAFAIQSQNATELSTWKIFVLNDTCPDYVWNNLPDVARDNYAEIIRAHLDQMTLTDNDAPENRDHYNGIVFEALCFLEKYPARKGEMIRRIKEGRLFISPNQVNTLWGMQSNEHVIRSFYAARRREQEWGLRMNVVHHIELPSLPWGIVPLFAACGVQWLNVPFLIYQDAFANLTNPPLFYYVGPDGSRLRVILDHFACKEANYDQGGTLFRKPEKVDEWVAHYEKTRAMKAFLASGTHSDPYPHSAAQAPGFVKAIKDHNAAHGSRVQMINATLPMFTDYVDAIEKQSPFLPTIKGDFGHSWESWAVSLAHIAAGMREAERHFIAAEALLALAVRQRPSLLAEVQSERERAEYDYAMLSDHAWNGMKDYDRKINADLRQGWADSTSKISQSLQSKAWQSLGLKVDPNSISVFNPLGHSRNELVRVAAPSNQAAIKGATSQIVNEEGKQWLYSTVSIAGFEARSLALVTTPKAVTSKLRATETELENDFYRLRIDKNTGGIASLIEKKSGSELIAANSKRTLLQTVYHDGKEHTLEQVTTQVVANGSVLARLEVKGMLAGKISVTTSLTLHAALDRVDVYFRINKPIATEKQRLVHYLPLAYGSNSLRVETTGAVIRPNLQSAGGDLLTGADTKIFPVQGFVDFEREQGGATIVPLDSFILRMDLDTPAIEALGNDFNYEEVARNQNGITDFRFRYALRGYAGAFDNANAISWARNVQQPLLITNGKLTNAVKTIQLNANRAVAVALKPAEFTAPTGSQLLRLWETAGTSEPIRLHVMNAKRVMMTDLLERDLQELPIKNGQVDVPIRPRGFAAIRLTY